MRISVPAMAAVLLVAVALFSSAERPARANEDAASRPSLSEARALLQRAGEPSGPRTLGPIGLDGFQWAREIHLGRGWVGQAVSCVLGGGILVFDPDGRLAGFRRTWEINSLQLFDFDEDGIDELIAEQKDGVGTGVALWNYHVYQVAVSGLTELWSGTSWSYRAAVVEAPRFEEHGFLRFIPSGRGERFTKLVHLFGPADGSSFERRVYAFVDGELVARDQVDAPPKLDEDSRLRQLAAQGLLVLPAAPPDKAFTGRRIPARGKTSSEMVLEDRP